MKYEEPNALIIYSEHTDVITTSVPGPLIPGEDNGDDNVEIVDF